MWLEVIVFFFVGMGEEDFTCKDRRDYSVKRGGRRGVRYRV